MAKIMASNNDKNDKNEPVGMFKKMIKNKESEVHKAFFVYVTSYGLKFIQLNLRCHGFVEED